MKICRHCGVEKALSDFPSKGRGVRRAKCKACRNLTPSRTPEARRQYHQRRMHRDKYGLEPEEFGGLRFIQDNRCAICGEPERAVDRRTGLTRELAVDHDHVTGKVRGLLCGSCNTGLGQFKDDPTRLQAAISYLGA